MKSRLHAFVSGRVQGVFYRYFTKSEATALELSGWVRNLKDGRVEVLAEGKKSALDKLLEKLKEGPPGAWVEDVNVKWEEYKGDLKGFRVVH